MAEMPLIVTPGVGGSVASARRHGNHERAGGQDKSRKIHTEINGIGEQTRPQKQRSTVEHFAGAVCVVIDGEPSVVRIDPRAIVVSTEITNDVCSEGIHRPRHG
jgi:hypothetical protein